MEWISTYKQDIEFAIDTFFKERYHREDVTEEEKKLREAVLYAVKSTFSGRIHPVLAMVVYEEVLGLTADTAIPVFIGLEFITISTRLHGELAGIKDPYKSPDISFVKKYGNTMTLLAGNALMSMGLECLSKWSKLDLIQETLRAIDDTGVIRWMTRDVLLDHTTISEAEYIALNDEEMARLVIASFLVWAYFASAASEMMIDQLKRYAVFLCRLYQVKKDMWAYEAAQSFPPSEREKNVVDFLWMEKTKALLENLQFELLKMTQNFQSSKFSDLIDYFGGEREIS